ncbi:MAG TPA: aminotransferase class III-fold pyridoxal phosphate-dependent enzyme [Woeseiaceae bacterium]|nr:aminotransferase class III-fold pyridoxal phosphate-dependent enzyme [Woeseiaceae bacterium]
MTSTEIRFLYVRKPRLDVETVRALVLERYGIDGEYRSVRSERDQNFVITIAGGQDCVVKISNPDEVPESIDFQVAALRHIEHQNPALPVPRVIANLTGELYFSVDLDGAEYIVHLLQYLPGIPIGEFDGAVSVHLRRQLGHVVAELDLALRGFFHPAACQDHPWNIESCARLLPHTHHIADVDTRTAVDAVLTHASEQVIPMLETLRHQVIHHDAHDGNMIVDDDGTGIAGIIDFGDMVFAPLVIEIAIASNGAIADSDGMLSAVCDVVAAYDTVVPLDEAEIDLVFDLIAIRHAMIIAIVATRIATGSGVPADVDAIAGHGHELLELQSIGRYRFTTALRRACRFPAFCPTSTANALSDDDEALLVAARHAVLGEETKHFYDKPLHFERARDTYLYGTDGRRYLDFYNNVPQVGHCHPHVVKAIARQAAALNTNTRYLYSSVLEYAERLTATLAPHLDACIFVNSGSEANDVAWQMARFETGGRGGLLMEDAYHGITDPIRLFSPGHPDVKLPDFLQGLAVPDPYRDPAPDVAGRYASDADRAIADLEAAGHPLAAFIVDSAFCSSGVPDVPDGYLRGVEKRVREAGGLMICDEVQSGFGRMGQWWGHEHHGVKADIVTMGKPAGNGHPLGIVVTSSDLLNRFLKRTGFFSTFGGNTVACAAGNAVLDVIENDNLIENGRRVGDYLREQLCALANRHELIGDVRGHGMLAGIEFVTDRDNRTPATSETARLLELMRERQVLVGKEGRFNNVLKLRPPLTLREAGVDEFISALDSALKIAAESSRP